MDCDEALVLLAAREVRTLEHVEETRFASHVESCETCREVRRAGDTDAEPVWWIMQAIGGSRDEPIIPTVNPAVFEIGEEVAAGGMGRVIRARDRRLGRLVAIKESLEHGMHARFEREALITAGLQHPAIVPIYEAGMWPDGTRFYTMRLVPGTTLAVAISEASTEHRLGLLRHVIAATEAVAHAHGKRIIHRDLKPGNILVGELGETVVIDWGIARRLDSDDEPSDEAELAAVAIDRQLTKLGSVLGTPGYMAPEQARGEVLDERADVFALGAVLYTLLSGESPYALHHLPQTELLARVGRDPAPSIDYVAPDAPKDLRAIVDKAMAFDPAERYPTAREMAEDLRRFETGKLLARPYKTSELIARWVRRHKAVVTIAMLATLTLVVVSALFVRGLAEARDTAETKQGEAEVARASADRERAASEASLAQSLEDQGRQAYLAGSPDRAIVLLAEALQRGRDTPSLRQLIAAATREGSSVPEVHNVGRNVWRSLAITGRELVLLDDDKVRIWSTDEEKQKFRLARDTVDQLVLPNGIDAIVATEREVSRHLLSLRTTRWSVALRPVPNARLVAAGDRLAIATDTGLVVIALSSGAVLGRVPIEAALYALSADGRYLAAVGADGTIHLWGDKLDKLDQWKGVPGAQHLAVLDGTRVVTAGQRAVTMWTHGLGPVALARDYKAQALVASPTTRMIAAGDNRGRIFTWGYDGDEQGASYLLGTIRALGFSPDGRLLAASDAARTVVFDAYALAPMVEVATPDAVALAWAADGNELAVLGFELARIKRPIGIVRQRAPSSYALPAGTSWVTLGDVTVVRALDSGAELGRFAGAAVSRASASADGSRMLLEGVRPREVRLVALPGGAPLATFTAARAYLTSDGQRVALLDETDGLVELRVVDGEGRQLARRTFARDEIHGVEHGPDPRSLFVLYESRIELVDLDTLAARSSVVVKGHPTIVKAAPRGDRVIVITDGNSNELVMFDLATGRELDRRVIDATVQDLWIAADGRSYCVQMNRSALAVYAVGQSSPLLVIPSNGAGALALDGSRLVTSKNDGGLEIWDVATGSRLEAQRYHRGQIQRIVWIDEDRFIVQASEGDETATVWSVPRSRASVTEVAQLARMSPWRYQAGSLVRSR